MKFKAFTIDAFIAKRVSEHPETDKEQLRVRLQAALGDYRNGVRCNCGNDIWVVGSAISSNGCFTCITGEHSGKNIPELEAALKKRRMKNGRRHIDDMDPSEIHGMFDDEGFEILPDKTKRPALCMLCRFNSDPQAEVLCNLTRYELRDAPEFDCGRFRRG